MTFDFLLRPTDEVTAWGTPENPYLNWYGLTEGWFWITTGEHELFRYTDAARHYWQQQYPEAIQSPLPYEDYAVARYWEELLERLPHILQAVPVDLAARVANADTWDAWNRALSAWWAAGDEEDHGYFTAMSWWWSRAWDAGHLAYPPRLWLWRVGDTIHLRWDNQDVRVNGIPVWTAERGEYVIPVAVFLAAIESFHSRLLSEMGRRVDEVVTAWSRPDVKADSIALQEEQVRREDWLSVAVRPETIRDSGVVPWYQVRSALAGMEARVQRWQKDNRNIEDDIE